MKEQGSFPLTLQVFLTTVPHSHHTILADHARPILGTG